MIERLGNTAFVREIAPECLPASSAFNPCIAGVPPGTAQWICDPDIGPSAPACVGQLAAFSTCLGF